MAVMTERCRGCAAKDATIAEQARTIARLTQLLDRPTWPMRIGAGGCIDTPLPDPTANCPCRFENGGSGICGCSRRSQITC